MYNGNANVTDILAVFKTLQDEAAMWHPQWQQCSLYVDATRATFTETHQPGAFLNNHIFDDTAPRSNDLFASAMIGLLWPNGGRSVTLEPVDDDISEDMDCMEWLDETTSILTKDMDDEGAGLATALDEFMIDQGNLGTSAIAAFENTTSSTALYNFQAWNVGEFVISEGYDGRVDTIMRWRHYTVRQLVARWGLNNLSEKTRQLYEQKKYEDKVKVLHVIQPRSDRNNLAAGNRNMPIASVYIEVDAKHLIQETGFQEMSVFVNRFRKKSNEKYGRSPTMRALPSILAVNALAEAVEIGFDKDLDPPLGMLDDGSAGSTVIDTSSGALNMIKFNPRSGTSSNPIFPLFSVGNLQNASVYLEQLRGGIKEHYYIDRLLDFNTDQRMTAREANIRNMLRSSTMRANAIRVMTDTLTPLVERCFAIGYRRNRYGYIPGSPEAQMLENSGIPVRYIPEKILRYLEAGKKPYKVKYISPAARELEAEQASAIYETWEFAQGAAQSHPEGLDNLDVDKAIRTIAMNRGAQDILRDPKVVEQRRQAAAERQQMQESMAMAQQAAEIGKTAADAGNTTPFVPTGNI